MLKKILILAFILSSSLYAGGNNGTIYTWGYFSFIVATLNALSGVIASGNDYLLKIAIALSMFLFTIRQATNPKGGSMLAFEFGKFLTMITLMVPRP